MTKAGEKLYGDWQRAIEADRKRLSVRMTCGAAMIVILIGIVGALTTLL